MEQFRLEKGAISLEGDNIFINGDAIKKRWKADLFLAICWTLFFSVQGFGNFVTFHKTHDNLNLFIFYLDVLLLFTWLIAGGYFKVFRQSTVDEISIRQISKVKK